MNRKQRRAEQKAEQKKRKAVAQSVAISTIEQDYAIAIEHHRNARWAEAEAAYRKVLAANPDVPLALLNLGAIILQSENYDEAIDLSRRAITLLPDHVGAHNNLGTGLQKRGQLDEAIAIFQKALNLAPDDASLHNNMANALIEKGLPEEAIPFFEQALVLNPDYAEAFFNKGSALKDMGRLEDAVSCFRRTINLNPQFAAGHYNLGRACTDIGLLDEALSSYHKAVELKPDYQEAHSNLLMTLHYAPSTSGADLLSAATHWARPYNEVIPRPQFANPAIPERRLRIGYVSADFSNHPVGFYLSRILPFHNTDRVEVACYSNSCKSDDTTALLRASSTIWRDVFDMSDEAMAGQITQDSIDILVDLSGHTAGHRLPVFARRPAPVQVTWMGYTGTTGLHAIDHILADHFVVPEIEKDLFSESVTYLPGCYLCFDPPGFSHAPVYPPAKDAGFITFGSFNNRVKITTETISAWAQILTSVAASRLLLKTPLLDDDAIRDSLLGQFASNGIDKERLLFEGRSPRADLLRTYQRVDIALDTQPFGGGVTTAEALWMGIPVITLSSPRWSGRLGETILNSINMPELVANSAQHYHDLAVALANDLPRLERLHAELRNSIVASPLCDGNAFVAKLELIYKEMWRNWCNKEKT